MGKTAVKIDRSEEATSKLIEIFETGELPSAIAQTVIHRAQSEAPSASWSLGNQVLMLLAGTQDARTYRQWQKVGRQVKPKDEGGEAFYILEPMKIKITDNETGEERMITRGFKGSPRFRIEDTYGERVEQPDYTPMQLPPLWERAEELGIKVDYAPYVGGFRGYYQPTADYIMLVTQDTSTFFHELAHAAHARVETLKGGQDARQEIIAETVSATLCLMYGLEGYVPHSMDYIAHYARGAKNPARAVLNVLKTVQQVLDVILETEED